MAWDPDERYLATASDDKTLLLWAAQTGERLRMLEGHSNYVFCCAFSPRHSSLVRPWVSLLSSAVYRGRRLLSHTACHPVGSTCTAATQFPASPAQFKSCMCGRHAARPATRYPCLRSVAHVLQNTMSSGRGIGRWRFPFSAGTLHAVPRHRLDYVLYRDWTRLPLRKGTRHSLVHDIR